MAIKLFLLESCPHHPKKKNRGLKFCIFSPLTSLEIIMKTC